MKIKQFDTNEYYHIYNRGNNKRPVFLEPSDYIRFIESMAQFNTINPIGSLYANSFNKSRQLRSSTPKLLEIICYCLNPNHFHLILLQLVNNGMTKFMHRLGTGYTNYFNNKYEGSGSLFQGRYKSIHIDSNEYLLHLSSYINLNDKVHSLRNSNSKSSWNEYVNPNFEDKLCDKKIILSQFKNISEYKKFALESLETIKNKRDMDNLLLE